MTLSPRRSRTREGQLAASMRWLGTASQTKLDPDSAVRGKTPQGHDDMTGQMHGSRDELAAINNAAWCAAMWRSHGLPVEQSCGMWFTRSVPPRFYPNAVTVDRSTDSWAQVALLTALATGQPAFAVKDSFACLPLASSGFRPLFDACWLWLDEISIRDTAEGAKGWIPVRTALDLHDWDVAWRRGDDASCGVFRPELLADTQAIVLAKVAAGGAVIGGCVGYDAFGVLGVTNTFGDVGGAVAALRATSPSSRIVRYEQGEDLEAARLEGFETLGPLRVWALA